MRHDHELLRALEALEQLPTPTFDLQGIPAVRESLQGTDPNVLEQRFRTARTDHQVESGDGTIFEVSVFTPSTNPVNPPCVLFVHGGGLIFCDRFNDLELALSWVEQTSAIVATVEYRLAPEHPAPAAVEDVFAAAMWAREYFGSVGCDTDRFLLVGSSAGAGLAAGATLMARDAGQPLPSALLLSYPMLDDRPTASNQTTWDVPGLWDVPSNRTAWEAVLGDQRGAPHVSPYVAPARATNFEGLPPVYLEVGSCDIFRAETVDFARNIWAAGGTADLHVYGGGFHCLDVIAPQSAIAAQVVGARTAWACRILTDGVGEVVDV